MVGVGLRTSHQPGIMLGGALRARKQSPVLTGHENEYERKEVERKEEKGKGRTEGMRGEERRDGDQ